MKISLLKKVMMQEDLNFLLTNRIPRLAATRFMGWLSKIESPLFTRCAVAVWRLFTDLDLSEAKEQRFSSIQACFTRELKPGARTVDTSPNIMSSPCDAIVGECGAVEGRTVFQAKGFPYTTTDLFGPTQDPSVFEDGVFVTLRLTSAMYHRFHAPDDLQVQHLTFISGDTWNVNPIALKRVERLFCKNERAVVQVKTQEGYPLAIVPVAAVLVASLRLRFLSVLLHNGYQGPTEFELQANYTRGEEMGWFQHGSTIIVFAPRGFELAPGITTGQRIQMGQALLTKPV
jgi:phosphatidylserine decarboxylase